MWYYMIEDSPNELYHFGVKGMKWGVRRYRNPDGSLTKAGKRRYAKDLAKYNRAQGLKVLSRSVSLEYNRPGVNPLVRANKSAEAARYLRQADKLVKSISKESMSMIKSEERKARIERAKRFEEEREIFRRHMDSILEEAEKGNFARHPGL